MIFQLTVPVEPSKTKINFNAKICFLGSCFSDEIGGRSGAHGLSTLSNPVGTIFHPIPLARLLTNCIKSDNQPDLFTHNKLFYDWDSSHVFSSSSEKEHQLKLSDSQSLLKEQIKGDSWLFVTFGTSIGYRHKQKNIIVANCHKQDQDLFEKEQVDLDEMYVAWVDALKTLYTLNPKLNIVFTVSPVRHIKDGLITNNQSKSQLFVLIEKLKKDFPVLYFPSYEIVIDGLRDYRFYKKDLIHPNEQAIDFVWSHFVKTYFSQRNESLLNRILKLRTAENHQLINKDKVETEKLEIWISKERKKINEELGKDFNL
ncbi:MAG: GSCFA domain-containing protein [Flavobacteriales bacterium]|nr:GSCFA domain-containing protein [Flavobacteriales bacterium]